MGGRKNIKLRCGAPLATRTCPDCSRTVKREQTPDGVCPGCGTRVEFRCPQPLTAVHPQCTIHPDNTPDALPMLDRIANTLGSSNARDTAREAFLKAANTPPEELHRLTTSWLLASAVEAQANVNISAQDRFEYMLAATRAAERFHFMAQLTARDKSDWEFRKHALTPAAEGGGETAQLTAAVVRVQYQAIPTGTPAHIMQAKAAAEKAFDALGDDGEEDT